MLLRTFILTMILLLAATGCTPLYETHYLYSPPESEKALSCVTECQKGKNQCLEEANYQYRRCRDREFFYDLHLDHCRLLSHYYKGRDGKVYYYRHPSCYSNLRHPRSFCYRETNQCDTDFQSCYTACGGRVTVKKVCSAFCDNNEAAKKETQPPVE